MQRSDKRSILQQPRTRLLSFVFSSWCRALCDRLRVISRYHVAIRLRPTPDHVSPFFVLFSFSSSLMKCSFYVTRGPPGHFSIRNDRRIGVITPYRPSPLYSNLASFLGLPTIASLPTIALLPRHEKRQLSEY